MMKNIESLLFSKEIGPPFFFRDIGSLNIKSPIRVFRHPQGRSRTELQLARAQVEPVNVFIDKLPGKVAQEYGARNNLKGL